MRIQYLDHTTKKNLLENLLKRSPNQYVEYEKAVMDILGRVKEEGELVTGLMHLDHVTSASLVSHDGEVTF